MKRYNRSGIWLVFTPRGTQSKRIERSDRQGREALSPFQRRIGARLGPRYLEGSDDLRAVNIAGLSTSFSPRRPPRSLGKLLASADISPRRRQFVKFLPGANTLLPRSTGLVYARCPRIRFVGWSPFARLIAITCFRRLP